MSFLTNPDHPPERPKRKKPKLAQPLAQGTRVKVWIKGYEDQGPDGQPSRAHPFIGTVLKHHVSGVGHIHLDIKGDERRSFSGKLFNPYYGFCDRIGFEYEVIDSA